MVNPGVINLEGPVLIGEGVYWVGSSEGHENLHCNPYLVVQDGKAVLIDGGNRTDFSVVMTKILRTGVDPRNIVALIYQHYDPDLCGSMVNLLGLCSNPDLKVISMDVDHLFIQYYIDGEMRRRLSSIEELDYNFYWHGRHLKFIPTPFAHCAGSFATFDTRTKILFSSDLFGSLSGQWNLFSGLMEECADCGSYDSCPLGRDYCPVPDFLEFHRNVMPTKRAVSYALDRFEELEVETVAPQHGSVIRGESNVKAVMHILRGVEGVGIDRYLKEPRD